MDYKNGKWAKKILELQQEDGSWKMKENKINDCTYRISKLLEEM